MEAAIRRFSDSVGDCGDEARELVVGDRAFRFEGLSDEHAAALEHRWGPYLDRESGLPLDKTIHVTDADAGGWLGEPSPGEVYRVEALETPSGVLALSYAFALGPADGGWRVALDTGSGEPPERSLENAARILAARTAAERGGFAMHSAGVLRGDRAWIFAGPSGAGKSTAVALSKPSVSLGDDFGVVWPAVDGWVTAPLPFDNAETIRERPSEGSFPVAGIWKLFKSDRPRVERMTGLAAAASLSSCLALPWVLPDLSDRLLEQVEHFCRDTPFGHLHFGLEGDFWDVLVSATKGLD
ncbi:MAG: hypothetical protein GTN89_06720 [Acidobacteria bacterium]|nr:hypothetical protein [Acidobacteriota bacterium]NIM62226.1 hypothetical protein [Acidobacteriota bacterium]NIO59008.1 hypothetical protein [Acidobacteriota bacterium]NIQ30054.1 hypothetical protein [Acidobacteriota bacterium]NIQ84820.1 hypothetical protein [Acidobacteriota bacterium]